MSTILAVGDRVHHNRNLRRGTVTAVYPPLPSGNYAVQVAWDRAPTSTVYATDVTAKDGL